MTSVMAVPALCLLESACDWVVFSPTPVTGLFFDVYLAWKGCAPCVESGVWSSVDVGGETGARLWWLLVWSEASRPSSSLYALS